MKKLLILLVMLFPLCGCVATAFVVGATAGGAIVYDKRSTKTMLADQRISEDAHYYLNQSLKGRIYIQVATFNRIVLMVGTAETPALRTQAYQIVSRIQNIRKIYNQVTIGKPLSLGQRTDDTWITTKVKSAMLLQKGLRSAQIKVVTSNNVVYLMGLVSPEQGLLAADVARQISGVNAVVKVFEYTK
ncbi:MAG: BON domain-containing protein [Gammaproteobacteria bacterium]|nr:BON domain-containing protein [Gammaproteobacteria bacterium]MCH9744380.1 BON domain-containing protein [Gammaproteobacteria bacterium]